MESLSRQLKSLSLKSPKKASGIHGLTLALGQTELRSTSNLPKIKQVAREAKKKFLILGHGSYHDTTRTFTVPEGVFVIFIAEAATYLSKNSAVDGPLTRFLTKNENIRLLLEGKIKDENLPEYLKGWKTRFYGPGERCRNVNLTLEDEDFKGTGLHRLPLKSTRQLIEIPGEGVGYKGPLSYILQFPGVYFVACCRKTDPLYQPRSPSLYTPINVFRGNVKTILTDESASQTLLKRRAVNSPIIRSAKKRRVSSLLRTN